MSSGVNHQIQTSRLTLAHYTVSLNMRFSVSQALLLLTSTAILAAPTDQGAAADNVGVR